MTNRYFVDYENGACVCSRRLSAITGTLLICCIIFLVIAAFFGNAGIARAEEEIIEAREESVAEDLPYDILGDEDTILKRRSRLQGVRMRTLYGPQAAWHGAFIETDDEMGSRNTLGATVPLSELWEVAALDHLSFFALRDSQKSAVRESLDLRIGMNPGRPFRPWLVLTPYSNFGDAEGGGLGVAAGLTNVWQNGAAFSVEAYAWRPWDEGYSTIVEDGRKFGAAAACTIPFTKDFRLTGRAFYEELELGEEAKSGPKYAGSRYVINARAYYRLLHRDDGYMDYGFRDDDLWNEYLVGSEMGIFMHMDFQRYHKPEGFTALNPVSEVFAPEIGLSFQYAISTHLGVTGEGFIGGDPDRDLYFGQLYGMQGRLVMVVNSHLRLWGEGSFIKTSPSLASSGGHESIISFGINYAF